MLWLSVIIEGHAVSLSLVSPHDASCPLPGVHQWLLSCQRAELCACMCLWVGVHVSALGFCGSTANHLGFACVWALYLFQICTHINLTTACCSVSKRESCQCCVDSSPAASANMSVSCLLVRLIDLKINCLWENKLVRCLSYCCESVTTVTKKSQLRWNSNRNQFSPLIFFFPGYSLSSLISYQSFVPTLFPLWYILFIHSYLFWVTAWPQMRFILLIVSLTHRLHELTELILSTSQIPFLSFLCWTQCWI